MSDLKGSFGIQPSSPPRSCAPCAAPAPRAVGRMPPTFTTRNLRCIATLGCALALARGVPNVVAAVSRPPPRLGRDGRVGVTGGWLPSAGPCAASPVAPPGVEAPHCRPEVFIVFGHG
eukprot:862979-Prymnesium_polylepis.1